MYGQGVLTITDDTQLNLSIGSKLKQPGEKYYLGLKDAFLNYGYLTATCTYGNSSAKFTQQTAFLDINLEYSAKINVEIDGTDYPIFLVPTGFPVHYLIAVPNGATVSSSFFKTRTIDVSDGKVVKRITRSLPTRCAPCAFSVSATKQVFFCTSNIGCEKQSSDYYRFFFHTHPWDIEWPTDEFDVGEDHSKVSQWDLFGWGTWVNGYTSAPSLTSMNVSDYKWVGSDPHKEAAVNPDAGWYTLTSDEWEYLINERAMYNDGPRYMRATIKDGEKEVPGLILFADSHQYWEPNDIQTWACSGDKVTSIDASFDGNVILASNWENWQKNQGAVFLPAAGCRIGTTIDKKYSDGYYWSSSKINSNFAWAMSFSKDGVQVNYVSGIAHHPAGPEDGFSVRLVQDIR